MLSWGQLRHSRKHFDTFLYKKTDNARNTVDISFTDSAFRRPFSFTDHINFILGSLGEDGGIFASNLQQEDEQDDEMDEIVGF
jgi:hypothetical protein